MPMIQGRLANFALDPASGTSYVAVGKLTSVTWSQEVSDIETSNHDSSGNREFIVGWKSMSIQLEMNHDDTDAGQEDLRDAWSTPATFTWRARPQTSATTLEYTGTGKIASLGFSGPNDGQSTMSATIQVTGAITRTESQA